MSLVSTKIRNFDSLDNFRFSVVAYDHGHPPKLTFVNVSVIVEDVNDNAPRCAEQIQKVSFLLLPFCHMKHCFVQIPEDYPNGALVTCIAAFDADIGENARITYGFDTIFDKSSSQLPFRIQPDTGCIFIDSTVPLDFETRPLYNITVEAMDNGQPTFSTVCRLVVELIDVNENAHPPIFSDIAHEASVYENQPIGTEVLALQATDPDDSVSPIKYSIVDGDGIGYFTIDPTGLFYSCLHNPLLFFRIREYCLIDRIQSW
ncbi:unnamed protein product [Anisakis simplex]|uniref:Cadherin domain-containing protein n=1 Tax=Anisakis simplex TaxID=6269 RepID=A0A3P6PD85_ANISI|nr:unnamed protein product [Anisakis simplex]